MHGMNGEQGSRAVRWTEMVALTKNPDQHKTDGALPPEPQLLNTPTRPTQSRCSSTVVEMLYGVGGALLAGGLFAAFLPLLGIALVLSLMLIVAGTGYVCGTIYANRVATPA